jgi:hypothetical protein
MQPHVNASNDEDVVFGFLDFADRLGGEAIAVGPDFARLQRASEGPCQSASCGRDDVVERRRARLKGPRGHLIMLSHRAVDTEDNRLRLTGEIGAPDRALHALDPDLRAVHNSGHSLPLLERHPENGRPTPLADATARLFAIGVPVRRRAMRSQRRRG